MSFFMLLNDTTKKEFDPQKAYEDLTPEEKESYANEYNEVIENPGKVDESLWKKAKEKAREQNPKDVWALTTYIYKQMGGEFH